MRLNEIKWEKEGNWEKENGKEKCFFFIYKVSLSSRMEMVVRINSKKLELKVYYIYFLLIDYCVSLF